MTKLAIDSYLTSMKQHIPLEEAKRKLAKSENQFLMLFRHGSLDVEYYKPHLVDGQQPHDRDEVYIVASGQGTFILEDERCKYVAGDVLFVPAGKVHRFENFTEDFATWVLFYGPVGGELNK